MIERDHFAYIKNDDVKVVHMSELTRKVEKGEIDNETLFFDHLVSSKEDFLQAWLKPLGESWHKRFV